MQNSLVDFKGVLLAQMERKILGLGNEAQFCKDLNGERQETNFTLDRKSVV